MKELDDLLEAVIRNAMAGLHVSAVGRVEAYDEARQRASVQPLVKRGYLDDDGNRQTELLPIVPSALVAFLGSGDWSATWPILKGHLVLLIFTDHSLDRLLALGDIVDPEDDRSHDTTDAIAIPFRPFSAPPGGAPSGATGALVIQAPAEIHVGGTAALATKADIDALAAYINTLPVGGTGSAPVPDGAPHAAGTTKLKGA